MTMTHDNNPGIGTGNTTPGGLVSELSEMLTRQGFEVHELAHEDGEQLTIPHAPKGRCELDVSNNGYLICEYYPWATEHVHPADLSRAVLRLLAGPTDELAGQHVDPHQKITLKGAVGCGMRARGLLAELRLSADETDFGVYADVAITNPEQPGRGMVCVTDDGVIWWECYADELTARAQEIAMALTDMLAPASTGTV
jgi:hypothetical protein